MSDKKWSNTLNKPWYRNEPHIVGVCDLEDNIINLNTFIDIANDTTETAIINAEKISQLELENKDLRASNDLLNTTIDKSIEELKEYNKVVLQCTETLKRIKP